MAVRLNKHARRRLKRALDERRVWPGERRRVLLLAEAAARVRQMYATGGDDPAEIRLSSVDEHALKDALQILEAGGLARSQNEYAEEIADVLGDLCEADSCTTRRVCRRRDGTFARSCSAERRDRLADGTLFWRGSQTSIAVATSDGIRSLDAVYGLVPISALTPSHDPRRGFAPTPSYPRELQERDYSHQAEREKVLGAAKRFRPELLLGDTPDALSGPPIIDNRTRVLGGNGRTMILQLAVAAGDRTYEQELAKQLKCSACYGLEDVPTEDVALVRILQGDVDAQRVSRLLNASLTTTLDRESEAVSLAQQFSDDTLNIISEALAEHETFGAAVRRENRRIVRALRRDGVITQADALSWLQSDHGQIKEKLHRAGRDRLKEALVGALVADVDALRQSPESLYKLWTYLAPPALQLSYMDVGEYDLTPTIRQIAGEAARTVLMKEGDFRVRYASIELFEGYEDENVQAALESAEGAVMLRWLRDAVKRPAATARALRAYLNKIPGEGRGRETAQIFQRDETELEEAGLDADSLRVEVLGMDSVREVWNRWGGPRGYLARRKLRQGARRVAKKVRRAAENVEIKLSDDLGDKTVDKLRRDLQTAIRDRDEDKARRVGIELRQRDQLSAADRRWLLAAKIDLDEVLEEQTQDLFDSLPDAPADDDDLDDDLDDDDDWGMGFDEDDDDFDDDVADDDWNDWGFDDEDEEEDDFDDDVEDDDWNDSDFDIEAALDVTPSNTPTPSPVRDDDADISMSRGEIAAHTGEELKKLRKALGDSKRGFARRIGVSVTTVSRAEKRGAARISGKITERLAQQWPTPRDLREDLSRANQPAPGGKRRLTDVSKVGNATRDALVERGITTPEELRRALVTDESQLLSIHGVGRATVDEWREALC